MDQELRDRFITLEAGFNSFKHDHNEEAKVRHVAIDHKLDSLYKLLNNLQCNVHLEKMDSIHTKIGSTNNRIDWLYIMFGSVIIGGVVLGLWINAAKAG